MKYYCSECGSMNIEARCFVPVNAELIKTQEDIDLDLSDVDDCWCNVCEKHTELVSLQEIEEELSMSQDSFENGILIKKWYWFKKGTTKESIEKWIKSQKKTDGKPKNIYIFSDKKQSFFDKMTDREKFLWMQKNWDSCSWGWYLSFSEMFRELQKTIEEGRNNDFYFDFAGYNSTFTLIDSDGEVEKFLHSKE